MSFLAFLILGGLAGWIASLVMQTDASQGMLLNIIVGVVGAFVGGWLFTAFGEAGVTGFNIYSLIVATIGAVVFIWLLRVISN